jgi:Ca-activated chloride channel family protein
MYSDSSSAKERMNDTCYTQIHANVTYLALEMYLIWDNLRAQTSDRVSLIEFGRSGKFAAEKEINEMTRNYSTMTALLGIAILGLVCAACASPASMPASSQPPPAPVEAPPNEPAPALTEWPPAAPDAIGEAQTEQELECCPPPTPSYPIVAPEPTPWPEHPHPEYGVKPFVDTHYDNLSTFAMDVDTASYTKMREYINSNRLPPPDLVRVEEFINYFNMEYPDPESGTFSINLEGGPSTFGEDGAHLLKVGIQGRHIPEWERKDAILTFVIDASGSMREGSKMDMVKYGLTRLVDQLGPNDLVGIVAFSNDGWVALEPTSVHHRKRILRAINHLRPMASTNTEAGLRLGYELALGSYRDGAINRLILASDGMANVGVTAPDVLVGYARDYYGQDIYLSTVGVGRGGYDDRFMERLANHGNGNYSYLDSPDAAERIFSQDLNGTLQVIAKDAKIQVDFNPDTVCGYRLLGYENRAIPDRDFRNDTVDAGEVGAGHSVTALYELYLDPEGGEDVVTVRVRYEDPDTHAVAETSRSFSQSELQIDFSRTSPRFQLAAAVAQYAEVLRQSPWTWDAGLYDVLHIAGTVQRQLPFDPDVNEFVSLVERASWLAQ